MTLKNRAGEVSTAEVAYDGDRNYRSGGTEMVTFIARNVTHYAVSCSTIPTARLRLSSRGRQATPPRFKSTTTRSIALAYQLSNAMQTSRKLTSRRELLDKQLLLARDQAARTAKD